MPSPRCRYFIASLALAALAGCSESSRRISADAPTGLAEPGTAPTFDRTVDANGGRFFWLPPLADNPDSRDNDAVLLPHLQIVVCALAGSTCQATVESVTSGGSLSGQTPALRIDGNHFQTEWPARGVAAGQVYRISALLDGLQISHLDVQFFAKVPKTLPEGVLALALGRTVPIKFRGEHGFVQNVIVAPAAATIPIGGTQALQAKVVTYDGEVVTDRVVTWASGNTAAASVDASGRVTGVWIGSAIVGANVDGRVGTSAISVVTDVKSASLSPSPLTLTKGRTGALTLSVTLLTNAAAPTRVTWSSRDPTIATVDQSGNVTAVGVGQTIIDVNVDGYSLSANVSVTAAVLPTQSLTMGTRVELDASQLFGFPSATWTTSDANIVSVSDNVATVLTPGSVTLTATSSSGSVGTLPVLVVVPPACQVASPSVLTLTPRYVTFQSLGATAALTATDANGVVLLQHVTWASGNDGVFVTDNSGSIRAVGGGAATITASSNGMSGYGCVAVMAPPPPPAPVHQAILVTPTTPTMRAGDQLTFTAQYLNPDGTTSPIGTPVVWSSGNHAVATVDVNGVVTGVSGGLTYVTASANGYAGTATLTVTGGGVTPPAVSRIVVDQDGQTIPAGQTLQLTAKAYDAQGNMLASPTFVFSSGSNYATVTAGGLVTASSADPKLSGLTVPVGISVIMSGSTLTATATIYVQEP